MSGGAFAVVWYHTLMIFKLSNYQPIDTMKADYCVVVWAVNLSEQTLFDLPLRNFDLRFPMVIICPE